MDPPKLPKDRWADENSPHHVFNLLFLYWLSRLWSTQPLSNSACFYLLSRLWSTQPLSNSTCFYLLSRLWSTQPLSKSTCLYLLRRLWSSQPLSKSTCLYLSKRRLFWPALWLTATCFTLEMFCRKQKGELLLSTTPTSCLLTKNFPPSRRLCL